MRGSGRTTLRRRVTVSGARVVRPSSTQPSALSPRRAGSQADPSDSGTIAEDGVHQRVLRALYPEMAAGGYSRCDPIVEFYGRVQSLLPPNGTVLDLGAGRGRLAIVGSAWRRKLVDLRGEGRTVVAVDPDPAVLTNTSVDQAQVMVGHEIPLPDHSVDLVVANWVLEHVEDAQTMAAEIDRVLRPGGWLCGHTPNRNGYVAVGNRVVPASLHAAVLQRVLPDRQTRDVFPAYYRMNTVRTIQRLFPGYLHASYGYEGPPHYLGRRVLPHRVARVVLHHLPAALAPTLMVFCRKPLED